MDALLLQARVSRPVTRAVARYQQVSRVSCSTFYTSLLFPYAQLQPLSIIRLASASLPGAAKGQLKRLLAGHQGWPSAEACDSARPSCVSSCARSYLAGEMRR